MSKPDEIFFFFQILLPNYHGNCASHMGFFNIYFFIIFSKKDIKQSFGLT